MFGGFSSKKLKPQLKMAVSRIQIASNKKAALLKQNIREIALMLSEDPPREEKAKIRAEALIRDDHMIEAYEILQLECELLHERIKLIECMRECPPDLVSVIATIMWASHRVDIPELTLIRKQFRAKYGKQFEDDALVNKNNVLNERVVAKLSVEPPAAYLVQTYLERICEQHQVEWTPKVKLTPGQMIEPMAAPVGYSVAVAQGTGLGPVHYVVEAEDHTTMKHDGENGRPPVIATVFPTVPGQPHQHNDFAEPDIFIPGAGGPSAPPGGDNVSTITSPGSQTNKSSNNNNDDDNDNGNGPAASGGPSSSSYADLAARFEQLKK